MKRILCFLPLFAWTAVALLTAQSKPSRSSEAKIVLPVRPPHISDLPQQMVADICKVTSDGLDSLWTEAGNMVKVTPALRRKYCLSSPMEYMQLSESGPPQMVVLEGYGDGNVAANEDTWVFQRTEDGHAVVLIQDNGSMYTRMKAVHNGMHDFAIFGKSGCCNGSWTVYSFDGSHYAPSRCYEQDNIERESYRLAMGPPVSCPKQEPAPAK